MGTVATVQAMRKAKLTTFWEMRKTTKKILSGIQKDIAKKAKRDFPLLQTPTAVEISDAVLLTAMNHTDELYDNYKEMLKKTALDAVTPKGERKNGQ